MNYADQTINSSSVPHPDAHNAGPTVINCGIVNGTNHCTYTGEGAALNDIYGTERDVNGVYYTGKEFCHMILHEGIVVPAAKRLKIFGPERFIQWLPEYPIGNIANGQ